MKKTIALGICAFFLLAITGCASSTNRSGEGAALGGILGAAAGGIIGHQSGHGGEGAAIGAAAGAITGAVVGSSIEKPAKNETTTAK
ncbi:MAG: glycine zipper domain-containing protein [Candidatus Omnitrophica bacterium]|nr:glycine zipper domain-containing protein [Candidatus Omnitrophota bacterium]